MTSPSASQVLERKAARWRRRQVLRAGFVAGGAALLAAVGVGVPAAWPIMLRVGVGMAVLGVGMGGWMWRRRRRWVTAREVARHYDRTLPELEDSCTLLLEPEEGLRPLAVLQRDRVAQRLLEQPETELFPTQRLVRAGAFFGVSILLAGAMAAWMPGRLPLALAGAGAPELSLAADSVDVDADDVPYVERLRMNITPPAYTGLPPRQVTRADVRVEEGAEVEWTATFSRPFDEARWVFSDGVVLEALPDTGATVRVSRALTESGFYSIEVRVEDEVSVSDFHRLDVTKDAAPEIVVEEPAPRVLIEPGSARRVALRATVVDDYRVASTVLVATVAKGSGENVKFREQTLPFDRVDRVSPSEHRLEKTLDLDELAVEPGDELYFFLRAADNRTPQSQTTRSETFFILLSDTAARMQVSSDGFGVDLVPEYFRSQRQIIIDTEALIDEEQRGVVDRREFEERSNIIGIDQKLLRLRYGQYLGEEFETGIETGVGEDEGEEGLAGQDHEEEGGAPEQENVPPPGDVTLEALTHMHDSEENATLFSTSVKSLLKASLAEMWEAELHLRLHRPRQALPYENRALDLLKETQQRARIYVKRIGFEPPPLKPEEQRLTGELEAITPPRTAETAKAEVAYPEIREALTALRAWSAEAPLTGPDSETLEAAGPTLARFAIDAPGRYLDALQALRTLLNDEAPCAPCRLALERAFWQILPPADVRPASSSGRRSGLGAVYLRHLTEG